MARGTVVTRCEVAESELSAKDNEMLIAAINNH